VAVSNELALMVSVVLDVKHQVDSYPFKAIRGSTRFSQVFEGPILMELFHLKAGGVLPFGVTVSEVQCHGMVIVLCHFVPSVLCMLSNMWSNSLCI